jgi:maleamate amidohydrolase
LSATNQYGVTDSASDDDFDRQVEQYREARAQRPRLGLGRRPAVIVVDLQNTFTSACGAKADATVEGTARLLAEARAKEIPVFCTFIGFDSVDDLTSTRWRTIFDMSTFLPGQHGREIDKRVAPELGDVVVSKPHASSFHGTGLDGRLRSRGVDTVLVTGASTSGCVRATAVESDALGYRTIDVEDCVYDPRPLPREASLSDLADRYADVVASAQLRLWRREAKITHSPKNREPGRIGGNVKPAREWIFRGRECHTAGAWCTPSAYRACGGCSRATRLSPRISPRSCAHRRDT